MNKGYKVAMTKKLEFNLNHRKLVNGLEPYDELLIKHKRRKVRKMARKPKVFVVSRGVHDYSAAEKFGQLHFLSDEMQLRLSLPSVLRQFTEILMKESSPEDYLLCTGLSFLTGYATAVFYGIHGKVNFLIYNKALGSYHVDRVSIPDFVRQENKLHLLKQQVTEPVEPITT